MRLQIARASCAVTGGAACKMIGRCALAAVSAGFFAISIGAFGADLGTEYSTAVAVPSRAAPVGRRPMPARPIVPHDATPDPSVQRARIVDQLYEEIMRRSSSECSSARNNASMAGAC
jgi:hypothetical protein